MFFAEDFYLSFYFIFSGMFLCAAATVLVVLFFVVVVVVVVFFCFRLFRAGGRREVFTLNIITIQ